MAEPRRRRPWIWIAVVLLVLLAAWWFTSISGGPDPKDLGPDAGASMSRVQPTGADTR